MGGEPLYQKELDILLEMIEKHPNPDCEINLVTNLMVPKTRIVTVLEKFKQLLIARKIKRLDITYIMPDLSNNIMKFSNEQNSFKHPFHVIADFESTLLKQDVDESLSTQIYQKHVHNSFVIKFCSIHNDQ